MSGTACDEMEAVKRSSYFKKSNIIIPFLAPKTEARTLPVHYCTPNLLVVGDIIWVIANDGNNSSNSNSSSTTTRHEFQIRNEHELNRFVGGYKRTMIKLAWKQIT